MPTGFDDFQDVLKRFGALASWAAASAISLPFVAAFSGVSPLWPSGALLITVLLQLIVLIVVFQFYGTASKRAVQRAMIWLLSLCTLCFIGYLLLFSVFTVEIFKYKSRVLIGYTCTTKALVVYGSKCPFLDANELADAAYNQFELWTKGSITVIRISMFIVWCIFFVSLVGVVAHFAIYQRRVKSRSPR